MGQTLTNGIYLPAEGERNCYEGLAANWTALDGMIGGYNVHISNTTIHVTAEDKQAWNGKADASALTAHTGDTTIHVTAEDKATWNGKADASALTAHTGDTTIHVTAADKQTWDGHVADSVKHVTAEDKNKWDAVTSKADDSAVVHKSGDETVGGIKTFIDCFLGKNLSGQTVDLNDCVDAYGGAIHYYYAVSNYTNISNKPENKPFILESKTVRYASSIDYIYYQKIYTAGYNAPPSIYTRYYRSGSASWSNWVKDTDKFVTTDTAQTISGVKTFEGVDLKLKSVAGEYTVSSGSTSLLFYDKNSLLLSQYKLGVYGGGIPYQVFNIVGYDSNNQQVSKSITFSSSYLDLSTAFLKPDTDNVISLGRTTNRWSDVQTYKVNNLEPSSLSLPSDRSARIDISSYFTNTGTGQSNSYTVPANGYIYLTLSELANVHCFSRTSGNVTNYAQTFTKLSNSSGALYVLFPVRKNDVFVATWYTTTTVSVDGAFFIPCRGNI